MKNTTQPRSAQKTIVSIGYHKFVFENPVQAAQVLVVFSGAKEIDYKYENGEHYYFEKGGVERKMEEKPVFDSEESAQAQLEADKKDKEEKEAEANKPQEAESDEEDPDPKPEDLLF